MRFSETKMKDIDDRFTQMKMENPIDRYRVGIGIELVDGLRGATLCKNGLAFADVEELGRMIEELQMLKEAIETETGILI